MQEFKRNKSLIKRNILNYLAVSGISKYEFYKHSKISRGTLDNTSGLTEENILKFLVYAPQINPDWLLLGKGEMLKSVPENRDEDNRTVHEDRPKSVSARIPLYNVRNAGAVAALFENAGSVRPEDHLLIPGIENCDGALYISGDAMHPLLKSGDIVIYKVLKDQLNSIIWGEMYLFVIRMESEELTVIGHAHPSEKGSEFFSVKSYNTLYGLKNFSLQQVIAFAHIRASISMHG